MRARVVIVALAAAIAWSAALPVIGAELRPGDPAAECQDHVPWGLPQLAGAVDGTLVCRPATYLLLHDDERHVPRWVAYHLTAAETFGCLARTDDFHRDERLPETGARPSDYAGSGYDQGHMKPAQDSAYDAGALHDSFSMANMVPQLPGLNRQEWERLEETVRAWAWERGNLQVVVGPVFGPHAKRIGRDQVAVPLGFFKVVVDPGEPDRDRRPAAIAFWMPQRAIDKGDLDAWIVAIADVEQSASVTIALPPGIDKTVRAALWHADLAGWRARHVDVCRR